MLVSDRNHKITGNASIPHKKVNSICSSISGPRKATVNFILESDKLTIDDISTNDSAQNEIVSLRTENKILRDKMCH